MTLVRLFAFLLSIATCAAQAQARPSSCLPEFNALQFFAHPTADNQQSWIRPLSSQNASGLFTSRVQMRAQLNVERGESTLDLHFGFDPSFDGVSLPYNLYAVIIMADGVMVSWMDFTSQCQAAGVSFFPGRGFHTPRLKWIGVPTQSLQIMVWGRL